jgi:E3 SUMO-protein ligase PIAS1
MIPFKDRGLRGKAGSAPPFDIMKGGRHGMGIDMRPGKMVALGMGHTGPTLGKKKDAKVSCEMIWGGVFIMAHPS